MDSSNFFFDALNEEDDDSLRATSEQEVELYKIFAEKPATLSEFLEKEEYIGSTLAGAKLSPVQQDFMEHFTQILKPETYRLMAECWGDAFEPTRSVNNLAVAWG